jgi:serine/threonine protein phosphatase PrpC
MIACDSVTPRTNPALNQDAAWSGTGKDYKVIAVADGLGSFEHADLAAKYVCEGIEKYVQTKSASSFNMKEAFAYAQQYLVLQATKYLQENDIRPVHTDIFGTTLIVAVETAQEFICGYCGNGGVFHIRGNFDHFQASQYLPWNAVNYLNPHTIQNAQGKEALYKLLSLHGTSSEYIPTVLRISKDNDLYGDMLVICTDGIFSNDQIQIGKDSKNNLWIQGEATIAALYEHLKPVPNSEAVLKEKINQYLTYLYTHKLLDDDATIGVCISEAMLQYHQQK